MADLNYFLQYRKIIENENRVGKSNIRLRNLYKISQYRYADGKSKNLSGGKAALVFIFGKVGTTMHGVKINSVRPADFISFLSKLKKKGKSISESTHLDEVLKNFGGTRDDDGNAVYKILKGSPRVYSGNYRTYDLTSSTYISEVFLDRPFLTQYFEPGQSRQEKKQVINEEIREDDID